MTGKITISEGVFPGQGETLIIPVFEDKVKQDKNLQIIDKKTAGKLKKKLTLHNFIGKEEEFLTFELEGFYKAIIVLGLGKSKDFSLSIWKKALASALRKIGLMKYSSSTIFYFDSLGKEYFEIGKHTALAFYLPNYYFDIYKSEEERKKVKKLDSLRLLLLPIRTASVGNRALQQGADYGKLIAEGIYLTRDLVNQPASHTHPETLVAEAFKIEKEGKGKIKVEVLDEEECRRLGMGAFLGVGQGSERKPKFIVLRYNGKGNEAGIVNRLRNTSPKDDTGIVTEKRNPKQTKICLIGKSITFDSGGLSLKPSEAMETMKIDMAGGATVLGVFKILAHLEEINAQIYGILPACENMPSGKALKPGDIVTALNKKTIEVLNTDAEGRLTLADAISYAEKYLKPDIIIDVATLTGACMVALGKEITGMFGNDEALLASLEKMAKIEGEELWHLPLYQPYAKKLKSDIADLKNITGSKWGGAISAALFLTEFVEKAKWVHFDIAGAAFNEGEIHGVTPKGATGWGVLTIMEYLRKLTQLTRSFSVIKL
jgi:leucyl aminopeptidase